ncbi:hypothetical protein C5167_019610 [Papaver somniferum]|uniref:Phytocyanin domain-containing protein n=1 Tax=Papaver somniferum TaxID=3469 RepID=A0A4Y7ITZ7_PAPSO|nr:hypothetical protein C5167_019610 [Papaver somniferum]
MKENVWQKSGGQMYVNYSGIFQAGSSIRKQLGLWGLYAGLRFVYDRNTTNVLEVTSDNYISCNASSPLAAYNTGNDTIPIAKEGYQYYISGNPVDCNNGLKVRVWASNSSYVRFGGQAQPMAPMAISTYLILIELVHLLLEEQARLELHDLVPLSLCFIFFFSFMIA